MITFLSWNIKRYFVPLQVKCNFILYFLTFAILNQNLCAVMGYVTFLYYKFLGKLTRVWEQPLLNLEVIKYILI